MPHSSSSASMDLVTVPNGSSPLSNSSTPISLASPAMREESKQLQGSIFSSLQRRRSVARQVRRATSWITLATAISSMVKDGCGSSILTGQPQASWSTISMNKPRLMILDTYVSSRGQDISCFEHLCCRYPVGKSASTSSFSGCGSQRVGHLLMQNSDRMKTGICQASRDAVCNEFLN